MTQFDDWTTGPSGAGQAERFGERTYMTFDSGLTLTYAGWIASRMRWRWPLPGAAWGQGDRVFCFVKNRAEFMVSLFGIMKSGAVFVPINTDLKGAFLEHQFRNAEPKAVLVDTDLNASF